MMNKLHFQPVTDTVSVGCNAAVVPIMPRVCAYVPMCLCAYVPIMPRVCEGSAVFNDEQASDQRRRGDEGGPARRRSQCR